MSEKIKYTRAFLLGKAYGDNSPKTKAFCKYYWGKTPIEYSDDSFTRDALFSFNTVAGYLIRLLLLCKEEDFGFHSHDSCMSIIDDWRESIRVDRIPDMPDKDFCKLAIIKSARTVSETTKRNLEDYLYKADTLANVMPLPKATQENDKSSMNSAKSNGANEFQDAFLEKIKGFFDVRESLESSCEQAMESQRNDDKYKVFWKNISYFNKFETWKIFVEENILQDFFEKEDVENGNYNKTRQLAPSNIELVYQLPRKKTLMSELTRDKTKCDIENFEDYFNGTLYINFIEILFARAKRLELIYHSASIQPGE